jgi:hypothetical protein
MRVVTDATPLQSHYLAWLPCERTSSLGILQVGRGHSSTGATSTPISARSKKVEEGVRANEVRNVGPSCVGADPVKTLVLQRPRAPAQVPHRRDARLAERADYEHAAIMRGDTWRGTFGRYQPASWWRAER